MSDPAIINVLYSVCACWCVSVVMYYGAKRLRKHRRQRHMPNQARIQRLQKELMGDRGTIDGWKVEETLAIDEPDTPIVPREDLGDPSRTLAEERQHFLHDIWVQHEQPVDAKEGDLWIDPGKPTPTIEPPPGFFRLPPYSVSPSEWNRALFTQKERPTLLDDDYFIMTERPRMRELDNFTDETFADQLDKLRATLRKLSHEIVDALFNGRDLP